MGEIKQCVRKNALNEPFSAAIARQDAHFVSGRDWSVSVQASWRPLSTHAHIFVRQSGNAVFDSLSTLIYFQYGLVTAAQTILQINALKPFV